MINMIMRRIFAYLIDLIFIILVTTMLAQIRILNPNFENYYDASSRYQEMYENAIEERDYTFLNSEEYKNILYEIKVSSVSNSIIEIVVYIAYFVGFQLWNKGQTLGKKLFKIKVVSKDDKPVKWFQLLVRTIIIYSVYIEIISIFLVLCFSQNTYVRILDILNIIPTIIIYGSLLMIILRKDGRGIHDVLTKTKVVDE